MFIIKIIKNISSIDACCVSFDLGIAVFGSAVAAAFGSGDDVSFEPHVAFTFGSGDAASFGPKN